ncbi:glycosyl hydrolase family 18 protein [Leptospira santarosai]|uniref:Hydrolase n=1 Tax=Leptospira santarosai TaxID=28183 RepID=A0AB73LK02_9LEPT|nr:glycosyl hydrolase family 18 protein [Leptospira santarosai]AVV49457.1 Glycosyl hydrolase, family 18 [Leptospira santarosai]MDI7166818.1 glycosyl hydrolase family 18 protein [Leptospira santarosai]MDI7173323.1 glycosyl hydrolase family 18 protein [Leptospira santarosai]MDI7193048.1 glycosyl hydrolase family 18 protein [Leptospira santarosai]MDO6393143.1 glycosyl hydrolase family 18 protein [Leptospira santarosai]
MAHEQEDKYNISEDLTNPVSFQEDSEPKRKILLYSFAWFLLSSLSFSLGIHLLKKGDSSFSGENVRVSSIGIVDEIRNFFPIGKTTVSSETKDVPSKSDSVFFSFDKEEDMTGTLLPKANENADFRASTWFSDYEAMKKTVHLYNEIHPFIYGMKGRETNNGDLYSSWGSSQKRERVAELRKLNPNVKIIPTIFRWENKYEKISENIGMKGRNDIRDKHLANILYELDTYDYDGIDIDYEGMSCEKKEKFEEFIVVLSKEIHKRGKILSVAVHPKTPAKKESMKACKGLKDKIKMDYAENWRGPMTHDYAFLAKYADRIKIMAYELHPRKYRNPGPGPQAPNTWIKSIIEYAKARVPSRQLYMAIPTYGYDWALNCNSKIKSVYYQDAVRKKELGIHRQPTNIDQILANSKNSGSWTNLSKFSWVHTGKTYEDPSIWYKSEGCDRVAFYMNRKAFEDKMNLLRQYDLGGFSFWQLISDNDPGINDYLELLVSNKLPPVEKAKDPVQDPTVPSAEQAVPEEAKMDRLHRSEKLDGKQG